METILFGAKKNLQDIRPTTDWTLSPCPLVRMVGPYLKLGKPQDEVMVLKVTAVVSIHDRLARYSC
jgi:hypothetical protein